MNGKLTALQRQYLSRLGKAEVEQPTLTGDLLSDLVQGWTNYTTERLKQSLINSKNPTGRASDSLLQSLDAAKTRTRGKDVIGAINANDYYQYVDGGRGPSKPGGKGELVKALSGPTGWISAKGIDVSNMPGKTRAEKNMNLAQAIARKIHTNGYKGNKFFFKIINDATFDEFAEYLGRAMGQKIALSISVMAKQDK